MMIDFTSAIFFLVKADPSKKFFPLRFSEDFLETKSEASLMGTSLDFSRSSEFVFILFINL